METCIFCKIVRKEIPVKIIFEDDLLLAFPDAHPQAKIHVLLIPKQHLGSLLEIDQNEVLASRLLFAANQIAKDLHLDQNGYRLVTNIGDEAGQSVKHLHFHLLGGETLGPIV